MCEDYLHIDFNVHENNIQFLSNLTKVDLYRQIFQSNLEF